MMKEDPFGDLRDWGRVLDLLDRLLEEGKLDLVQPGLVRLLRFQNNWQIREKTLLHVRAVSEPSEQLLAALLEIVADHCCYVDARILAVNALAVLIAGRPSRAASHEELVLTTLRRQTLGPEAPVFNLAVERAIEKIGMATAGSVREDAVGAHSSTS